MSYGRYHRRPDCEHSLCYAKDQVNNKAPIPMMRRVFTVQFEQDGTRVVQPA